MKTDQSSVTTVEHIGIGTLLREPLAVPPNQRAYAWRDDEIDDLLSDITWAMDQRETEDREYFLGSIVLTTASISERPSVVDGQQRLASVAMIFAAIRDYLIRKNETETANLIANGAGEFLRVLGFA